MDHNTQNSITPQTIQKNILDSLSEEQEFKEREVKRLKQNIHDKIQELEKEGDIEVVIQYLEDKMQHLKKFGFNNYKNQKY